MASGAIKTSLSALGAIAIVAGNLAPYGVLMVAAFLLLPEHESAILGWLAGGAAWLVSVPFGALIIRTGRRIVAAGTRLWPELSDRPLVLYARSFQDERVAARDLIPRRRRERTEERLGVIANGAGQFVTIGRPGEALPPIGATRIYVPAQWEHTFERLARQARLFIVYLRTRTAGVAWELEHILVNRGQRPVLLLLPEGDGSADSRDAEYAAVLAEYQALLSDYLPATRGDMFWLLLKSSSDPPLAIGPRSHEIRNDVQMLNEEYGLILKPADLGIGDIELSAVCALEQALEDYQLPPERELPLELQVTRALNILLQPIGMIAVAATACLRVWGDPIAAVARLLEYLFHRQ